MKITKKLQIKELYLKLLPKNRNRLRTEQREKLQVAWRKGQVSFSRTEEEIGRASKMIQMYWICLRSAAKRKCPSV